MLRRSVLCACMCACVRTTTHSDHLRLKQNSHPTNPALTHSKPSCTPTPSSSPAVSAAPSGVPPTASSSVGITQSNTRPRRPAPSAAPDSGGGEVLGVVGVACSSPSLRWCSMSRKAAAPWGSVWLNSSSKTRWTVQWWWRVCGGCGVDECMQGWRGVALQYKLAASNR